MPDISISTGFASENKTLSPIEADIQANRDLAAFCYTLIFAPILLLTRRESPFLHHHSQQACYLAFFFILFALLPGALTYLNVLVIAGALMGFLEAQAGHWYQLPIVSGLINRDLTMGALLKRWKKPALNTFVQSPNQTLAPSGFHGSANRNLIERISALEAEVEKLKTKSDL